MDRIKKHSNRGFTTVSNVLLNDENISFKAKGVFVYLWSKPDDWVVRITDLCNHGKEGKTAIYSALQELEDNGYLTRARYYENGKIAGIDYELYDEKLNSENLNEENLNQENPTYSNKEDIQKTNLLQNKEDIELPAFIDKEVWANWVQHRKELKKKLTPTSKEQQFKKLTEWHNQGYNVNLIINHAISSGWQGFYLPNEMKITKTAVDMMNVNGKNYSDNSEWLGAQ